MIPFSLAKDTLVIETEVSEKIDDIYLKDFVVSNLKLKNISLGPKDRVFINYLINTYEYQIIILKEPFSYFEFEPLAIFYDNKKLTSYTLFICSDFISVFYETKLYYYQKMDMLQNKEELLSFLTRRLKIEITSVFYIEKNILEEYKEEFLKNVRIIKPLLKEIKIKKNFGLFLYVFWALFILIVSLFIYFQPIKEKKKEEIISIEDIKNDYKFYSFVDEFYKINQKISENNLKLISFDFRQNSAIIVINSYNKQDINRFLSSLTNINFSTISFFDEKNLFEANIDVDLFK